jgi:hypothetical protein
MMHCWPVARDSDEFWRLGPMEYAKNTSTDLKVGRKAFTWMSELGLKDVRVDYVTVDTVRVERETFAQIWEAWRDGYTDAIAEHSTLTRQQVREYWSDMISAIRDANGYACWQVPIISAKKP